MKMGQLRWRLVIRGPHRALRLPPSRETRDLPCGALLRVPAGFESPLHRHSRDEQVVMLSGTSIHWTEAGSRDTAPLMTAGDYLLMPAGTNHVSAAGTAEDALEFITQDGPSDFAMSSEDDNIASET